ncbi:tail protein X, partial [Escherichia coli]|uniref:tail protein X n=1 Tax=Escherichia coli TaxID=562 RepID=UPI003CC7CE04
MARCALVRGRYSGSPPSFCGAGVMKVRALQGDTVDLLCFRHYGTTQGVTAQV